jgi:predicted TIM-barrel fold metal-dependent hydrolase
MFDFNVHLPCRQGEGVRGRLADEASMSLDELKRCYATYRTLLGKAVMGANFMLFNEDYPFGGHALARCISEVRRDWSRVAITQLLDFRRDRVDAALDYLLECHVDGIKFHSYVQKIDESDFPVALAAAKAAAERGFFICIDASYGTTRLYDHDNLRLAALLIREIRSVPIIILHSGGVRCWDAMLLALDGPNVYLETSFTLPCYRGSSIESDLSFIYRKIGIDKVLYASDFPYVSLEESTECIGYFFERFGFSQGERDAILGENAHALLDRLKR